MTRSISFPIVGLWLAATSTWLITAAVMPVAPWKADSVLRGEQSAAQALVTDTGVVPFWSIDIASPRQRGVLRGWGEPEREVQSGRPHSFRRLGMEPSAVAFACPRFEPAHVTIEARGEAGAAVDVLVDGNLRGHLEVKPDWSVVSTPIEPVEAGAHRLELRSTQGEILVAGVAVGHAPVAEPARDLGFAGWFSPAFLDRAAVILPQGAPGPENAFSRDLPGGSTAWYGFGIGGRAGWSALLSEGANGIAAAALVTLLPGLLLSRGRGGLGVALALSSAALVTVFLLLRAAGVDPSPLAVALGLLIAGSAGLRLGRRDARLELPVESVVLGAVALVALCAFAARVVPPLDDQDLEVQGTAHALAARQVPMMVTDRGTTYFFAHPTLLHVWVAGSFALAGRLDLVADADLLAQQARASRPFSEEAAALSPPPYVEEWMSLRGRFSSHPELWPTRAVNVALAALAVGVLAHLASLATGSWTVGAAAGLVFASFPEFLVRGAYGGYFSAGALLTLLVLAALRGGEGAPATSTTSALAFLVDQKGLLAPCAWALVAPWDVRWRRLIPLAGGILGVALYVAYGLSVDAPTFTYDFLKVHVINRLTPVDVRFAHDAARGYPSIPELWLEFAGGYGVLFTVAGALAAVRALRSTEPAVRAAGGAVLLGALIFSMTDWRQTKHLSLLAAPAVLALAAACPRGLRWRPAWVAGLLVLAARNVWTAWPLLHDFEALRPRDTW